jgi:hypothetical protein
MFHPDYFSDRDVFANLIEQSNQLDALLDTIIEPTKENQDRLFDQEKRMLELNPVDIWNVYMEESKELQVEKEFQMFMLDVAEHIGISKDEMTVGDFYMMLENLKRKSVSNGRESGSI